MTFISKRDMKANTHIYHEFGIKINEMYMGEKYTRSNTFTSSNIIFDLLKKLLIVFSGIIKLHSQSGFTVLIK